MKKGYLFLIGFAVFVMMSGSLVCATNSTAPGMATVSIGEFISLTITPGTITFGNMLPNENKTATNNPLMVTIGSETNVGLVNITTKANQTSFLSWDDSFYVGNMTWINATYNCPQTPYSTTERQVYLIASYGQNYSMNHTLSIPTGQASGFYSTGIIITAKNV
ncbi:MAG: hypothetical protein PHH00_02180 [Candidatus Nanoarchaeia archaeon]|nr:hypothetical protein [Candidatus Nanoarchaeia archaeon]